MLLSGKARAFWPLLFLIVFTDCATKRLAEGHLYEFAVSPYQDDEGVPGTRRFGGDQVRS